MRFLRVLLGIEVLTQRVAELEDRLENVTEKVAAEIRDEVESRLYGIGFPLVLEIPDPSGPVPGRLKIEEVVRRAIGISI